MKHTLCDLQEKIFHLQIQLLEEDIAGGETESFYFTFIYLFCFLSTFGSEVMVLDGIRVDYFLAVSGNPFPLVEEFKCLRVLFTIEVRMECETHRRTGVVSAVMLHRSVSVKKEPRQNVKLLIYSPIYVPTLIYGNELWVTAERTRLNASGRTELPPQGDTSSGTG